MMWSSIKEGVLVNSSDRPMICRMFNALLRRGCIDLNNNVIMMFKEHAAEYDVVSSARADLARQQTMLRDAFTSLIHNAGIDAPQLLASVTERDASVPRYITCFDEHLIKLLEEKEITQSSSKADNNGLLANALLHVPSRVGRPNSSHIHRNITMTLFLRSMQPRLSKTLNIMQIMGLSSRELANIPSWKLDHIIQRC